MLPIRLIFMPFLQHWDGTKLDFRLLTTPQGNPLTPLVAGEPAFVDAAFTFEVRLAAEPKVVPSFATPFTSVPIPAPVPPDARAFCEALAIELSVDASIPPVSGRTAAMRIMKYAPPAYREAADYRGGMNPFLVTDESYHCALKSPVPKGTSLKATPPRMSWGRILGFALRQPLLAEATAMVRPLSVVPPAKFFEKGGWIYVTLAAASPGAGVLDVPGAIKLYAARVPPLSSARSLFTPVLFPVADVPPPVSYDTLFHESVQYDDGFAKTVYARQPLQADPIAEEDGDRPIDDRGVQLGWDDEQVVTWLNRQLDPLAAEQDAPMGVFGFRVDARHPGDPEWHSLVVGHSKIKIAGKTLGPIEQELRVDVSPGKIFGDTSTNYWLPSYYTAWTGPSLAARDGAASQVLGAPPPDEYLTGVKPAVDLRYGEQYEFRVRLADLTNGGPAIADEPRNPAPQPSTLLRFVRWVRPGPARLVSKPPVNAVPDQPPASLKLRRPLLSYPANVFAGGNADDVLADMATAKQEERGAGTPDPDVTLLEIEVQVESPGASTRDGFLHLYTTTRPFPDALTDPLELQFEWQDIADARLLPNAPEGPLALPTSRNVRLVLTTLCAEKPDYYGAEDVRRGPSFNVSLRRNADDEKGLLVPSVGHALEGLYLQPAQVEAIDRLAEALGLEHTGLMLRAKHGRRTMFGCSAQLRHVIGPDGASLTFASAEEITRIWLVAVRLDVMRDWSWDGLDHLSITRDGDEVGRVEPRGRGGHEAHGNEARDRSSLVFIDAIDPKPAPGKHPRPLKPVYRATPVFRREPLEQDAVSNMPITLPATTPPVQVPKIVSAGMAMSPYVHDPLYTSTAERQKALWIEIEKEPADPEDTLYARVLAYAPDPVLTRETEPRPEEPEPPLPIDPEPIRRIVPGQADDLAGANAMQRLIPTDSKRHFLVPIPSGLTPDSAELHGFFTYELRFGHSGFWSTAQGRFGRPLRVTGIQHAAPQLRCAVTRTKYQLEVTASFANPIRNGRSVRPLIPATGLWALLYAQIHQADAEARRNILLGSIRLFPISVNATELDPDSASGLWTSAQIQEALAALTLGPDTPLSCLAVETIPGEQPWPDPLGVQLGYERFLRTSTLVQVPGLC